MMPADKKTKEKLLAGLTVFLLFLAVGSLLFYISRKNMARTDALRQQVIKQKTIQENKRKLEKIYLKNQSALDGVNYASPATAVVDGPAINGQAFLTLALTADGTQKVLTAKNPDLALPIASITKLMVAAVIAENVDLETAVTVTADYIGLPESALVLELGRTYRVKDLLANALIASDNDSARLLASTLGENNFLARMNQLAETLGMTQTNFVNVTGLDTADAGRLSPLNGVPNRSESRPASAVNVSTVSDLAKLLLYLRDRQPALLALTTKANYNFCDIYAYCRPVMSTNKLLENKEFGYKIIGGKTGSTALAQKNLALLFTLSPDIDVLNIVLGSPDNFSDTLTLISQIKVKN